MKRSHVVALVLAALVVGYLASGSSSSPFMPGTKRPILAKLVKAAKGLLWLSLAFEPPPPDEPAARLVQAPQIGEDGFPIVDHGRGW